MVSATYRACFARDTPVLLGGSDSHQNSVTHRACFPPFTVPRRSAARTTRLTAGRSPLEASSGWTALCPGPPEVLIALCANTSKVARPPRQFLLAGSPFLSFKQKTSRQNRNGRVRSPPALSPYGARP